ncbi:D-alanyl-D-alanine carboxypeptidase family protein [Aureimonas leprariae]|nr:D-alanyl-D-alanine carboxypeptidase family protein [Aureimonas leprariae]
MPKRSRAAAALLGLLALAGCQSAQLSADGVRPPTPSSIVMAPQQVTLGYPVARALSELVVDYDTGRTLYEVDADGVRYPASLTKMMTLYLLFDAVDGGRVSLDDTMLVSENAARQSPSKLGLRAGSRVRVSDLAHGIATKSANDAAMVVAENLGGSVDGFAKMMMAKARSLKMTRSNFVNPNGLPDPRQMTTARDMATLARALRANHPRFTSFYAQPAYAYEGKRYRSTNHLLGTVPGVDGMKTGYIRDSGFNLVASAQRGGRRVIVVVIGGATGRARDAEVTRLIDTYLGPAEPQSIASLTQ